ncbi:P-loop containing nucleoside triphosphate hydrolase protein [Calocera cornea HHB12733]|uniref:p-loop containing nucleoside triphosphate hydrolase protein n=1 Tax=Calocera cornea HHB12733 TaxID=1353952 RepID=A0A165E550_9BASI|nr:P-loop containing nucleoside triphosphate hydrolase protein [Calocera cornea HHB12733]
MSHQAHSTAADPFVTSLGTYFAGTDTHTAFALFVHTRALYPDKQHVFVEDGGFQLSAFLLAQGYPESVCEGEPGAFRRLEHVDGGYERESSTRSTLRDGTLVFDHKGTHFRVLSASWMHPNGIRARSFHFVFDGVDDAPGRELVKEVYDWAAALKDEIWVFTQGCWQKDAALYKAIEKAEWDDIVLDEHLVRRLKANTDTFFASKQIYQSLNVAWKRGILLLGPPGNGKTQTIQVLLKDAIAKNIRCLYVKSFDAQRGAEHGIRMIFQFARMQAPCIIVLEDLDAMVQDDIRSFFLNELDGLERNEGILTIATTNHPERIDDAILRRPSRFDQKYNFNLPTLELRQRYILKWLGKIQAASNVSFGDKALEDLANDVAEKTEEWSFAFLKELFLSFLLRSASDLSLADYEAEEDSKKTSAEILLEQVGILGEQVSRGGLPIGSDPPAPSGRGGMVRRMMRGGMAMSALGHMVPVPM